MPRLLLVDDNQSIHKIAESLLAPSDVELVCAKSGAEALALLDGGASFDAFLLDISMAGMDGWTLLQTLRARPDTAKTPAAMMAGVLDVVDPDRLARAPMQDYLKKPVELKDLVARVHQLLTRTVVLPEPPAEAAVVAAEPEPVAQESHPHEAFETVPHLKVPDALRAMPAHEEDLLVLEESDLLPEAASADLRLDDLDSLLDAPVQEAETELPDLGEVPESPITSDLPDLGEDTQTVTAELPSEGLPDEAVVEPAGAVPAEVESEPEMTLDDLVASPAASLAAPPPEDWADESDALVGELDLDLQATSVAIQAEDLVLDGDLTAEGLDLEDVGSETLAPETVEPQATEIPEAAAEVMEEAEPVALEAPAEAEAPEPVLEDVEPVTLADVEAALEDGTFDLPSEAPAAEMQVPMDEMASPEAEAAPLSEAPAFEPEPEPELEVAEEPAPVAPESHADVLAAGAVVAGAVGAVAVGAVASGAVAAEETAPAPAPVTPAGAVDVHAMLDALLADPVAMDRLSKALAERLSDHVLREVAWEIMPDVAERLRS